MCKRSNPELLSLPDFKVRDTRVILRRRYDDVRGKKKLRKRFARLDKRFAISTDDLVSQLLANFT
jgi:hypothetical protein